MRTLVTVVVRPLAVVLGPKMSVRVRLFPSGGALGIGNRDRTRRFVRVTGNCVGQIDRFMVFGGSDLGHTMMG